MQICWDNLENLIFNKRTGKWHNLNKAIYIYIDSCSNCNEPFLIRSSNFYANKTGKMFCSQKCQKSFCVNENATNFKNISKYQHCLYCNKSFFSERTTRKYCSHQCKSKSQEKKKVKKICDYCNGEYFVCPSLVAVHNKRKHKNNFCSKDCRTNFFTKENSPNWIKDRCKIKDANKTLRWSIDMNLWREYIFKRDNYTCVMCGNRSSKHNPIILNAHHIRPFSKYKKLIFDKLNGVTLCYNCHALTFKKEDHFFELFDKYIKNITIKD